MKVVVAPDKFKGSLTAAEAAAAMRLGVLDAVPGADVECVPVADGGEGTVDAFAAAGAVAREVRVVGPLGEPTAARFAIRGDTAVVEAAQACGLALIDEPGRDSAVAAGTEGVAQLIAAAGGAGRIVLGVGGSGSTDGGAGLARGLGARLLDRDGRPIGRGGGALLDLDRIDVAALRRPAATVTVASDVTAPLPDAARVFAAQKGARPDDIARLERALRRWAEVVARDVGIAIDTVPGGGAAGGLGAGAIAFLGATIVSGVDVVLDLLGFADRIAGADLVLTGEGSFDEQSLSGKAPIGVVRAARRAGVPAWIVAGRATATTEDAAGVLALTDLARPEDAIRDAAALLRRRAADAVRRAQ